MNKPENHNRQDIFAFPKLQKEIDEAVTNCIRSQCERKHNAVFPPENSVTYSHGRKWVEVDPDLSNSDKSFETHSVRENIKLDDIVDHKLDGLLTFINSISDAMHNSVLKNMYSKLYEVTDRTGNVVSQKEAGSAAEAFLQMLRKIEFGVNRDGTVSRPEIHAGREMSTQLISELEAAGEEFKQEIEQITVEKEQAALTREAERKAKFVSSGVTE